MAKAGSCLPKMAANHYGSRRYLDLILQLKWNACQEESRLLISITGRHNLCYHLPSHLLRPMTRMKTKPLLYSSIATVYVS